MTTSRIRFHSDEAILEHISLLTETRETFRAAMLDPASLERDCPLDNGRHDHRNLNVSSLGCLHQLPTEILHMIFVDVDLESLTTMRRVSHGVRNTIDSIWQYQTCTKSNFKHGYIPKSNRRIAYWSTTKIFVSSCVCSGGKSHQDPYCAQLSKF